MALRIPEAVRNAMLDAIADRADAGPGAATLKIYTGAQPATGGAAVTGTLLATFTLVDPAYGAATGGVVTLDADPDISASAATGGTAGWGRIADSTGATVYDGECGLSGSGKEFILNTLDILSGQTILLLESTISIPAG